MLDNILNDHIIYERRRSTKNVRGDKGGTWDSMEKKKPTKEAVVTRLDILYSNPQLSPEEREAECQRLKEESDKLTKWPEIN